MDFFEIKNKNLAAFLFESNLKIASAEELMNRLSEKYSFSSSLQVNITKKLNQYFIPYFNKKFKASFYNKDLFLKANEYWLETVFTVSNTLNSRKKKNFTVCSGKTKKRRMKTLKQEVMNEDFDLPDNMKMFDTEAAVNIIKEEVLKENNTPKLDEDKGKFPVAFTNDEALALFIDLKLTKSKYKLLKKRFKEKNADILPSYKNITTAKLQCYPQSSDIQVNENGATIKLQGLLDHTAKRIFDIEEVHSNHDIKDIKNFKLKVKYGCDGTSGLNPYKYTSEYYQNPSSNSSLFLVSMVPLSLQSADESITVWQDNKTSSPNSCLPIAIHFEAETKGKIIQELENIKKQINRLKKGKFEINGIIYNVDYELMCTMVDGKVCQVITETNSASNCTVCGATPVEMNDLKKIKAKDENVDSFQYGLQTLHAWIRFMECILHIAYKITIQQWKCKGQEQKKICQERKQLIQTEIRKRLGLIVDAVRQGSGSTNDGNTARKFFANYEIISEITGVNCQLLKNMYIILQVMSCGKAIDVIKFQNLATETAKIYVQNYSWYYMPASLHKVLIHGAKIINSFVIPIGQLSEKAQESRNKDIKRSRESNTRKMSFTNMVEDLIHHLLISADPYLCCLRSEFKENEKPLIPEANELLVEPIETTK